MLFLDTKLTCGLRNGGNFVRRSDDVSLRHIQNALPHFREFFLRCVNSLANSGECALKIHRRL